MKYRLAFTILVIVFITHSSKAVPDTTYRFYNSLGEPTAKDSADYYSKIYKLGKLWHQEDYWIKTGKLRAKGNCIFRTMATKTGEWNWYYEDGTLNEKTIYDKDGLETEHFKYYPDGKNNCHVILKKGKPSVVEGWDEQGNIVPGFIYRQNLEFPEGIHTWIEMIRFSIESMASKEVRRGKISGSVLVTFKVDTTGSISEIKLLEPSKYAELNDLVLAAIKKSPKWTPAIMYNKKKSVWAKEYIRFE
jgi:TonB family protein